MRVRLFCTPSNTSGAQLRQAGRAPPRPRDAGGGGRRQSGEEALPRHRRGEPAGWGPLPVGEAAIGAFRPDVRRVKRAAGHPLRPVFRG